MLFRKQQIQRLRGRQTPNQILTIMHKVIKPSGDAVGDESKSLVSVASKLHKLLVKEAAARTAVKKL